jgi:hypothetical protein
MLKPDENSGIRNSAKVNAAIKPFVQAGFLERASARLPHGSLMVQIISSNGGRLDVFPLNVIN